MRWWLPHEQISVAVNSTLLARRNVYAGQPYDESDVHSDAPCHFMRCFRIGSRNDCTGIWLSAIFTI